MPIANPPVVLVVDDQPPFRELARRLLEPAGYRVLEATDGLDGLRVVAQLASIDLLIADLDMPALSGEEMTRQIRATHPDLKVLYVTGIINRLMDDRPVLWEGEAFLEKPYSGPALLEAVSLLLHGTTKSSIGT